jgi:hypothetical protein
MKYVQNFGCEARREETTLEVLGEYCVVILKLILRK